MDLLTPSTVSEPYRLASRVRRLPPGRWAGIQIGFGEQAGGCGGGG